jgi:hypothetical protein
MRQRGRFRLQVQTLVYNATFVQVSIIPGLLYFLDLTLRLCLSVDLVDAGADMAMLAVGSCFALLVEDIGRQHKTLVAGSIIIFLIPWVACLKMVSVQNLLPIGFLRHLFFALSLLFGCSALVLSGVLARFVIQGLTDVNGRDD